MSFISQVYVKGIGFMTKIRCKKCGDIIEGDYQGTFKQCQCKTIYIDETKYYCRIGFSSKEDFEIVEDENNSFKKLKEEKEKEKE